MNSSERSGQMSKEKRAVTPSRPHFQAQWMSAPLSLKREMT
jgi:hypothetical protein